MKKYFILIIGAVFSFSINAQSLIGAWETEYIAQNGEHNKSVVIFSDGYQVISTYHSKTGEFISTNGGTWELNGDTMTEIVEFNSNNSESIGKSVSFKIALTDSTLSIIGDDMILKRLDSGKPGKLHGAWLMSGKVVDEETQLRDTSGPRKTMKILSGTRFQWIAYNTETKEFKGTGGGTYSTENGVYTENIEFFSKNNAKVGASLDFNYKLVDDNWHHSGLSSKGEELHEIWAKRE